MNERVANALDDSLDLLHASASMQCHNNACRGSAGGIMTARHALAAARDKRERSTEEPSMPSHATRATGIGGMAGGGTLTYARSAL